MTRILAFFASTLTALSLALSSPALASSNIAGVEKIELRPGWRMANGTHMSAIRIVLEPGWKTYWRAPGDFGIPPQFDWSGSRNIARISTQWPTPEVFFEQGFRSVGYRGEVIIPLSIRPADRKQDLYLKARMQIGLCKEVCIPTNFSFESVLPEANSKKDPIIAAAQANIPYTAKEAGVTSVTCQIKPGNDGALNLNVSIELPSTGDREYVVVEAGNPLVWVAEPVSKRQGITLHASTQLEHVERRSFALDRSALRFTILGTSRAVDIQGCTR